MDKNAVIVLCSTVHPYDDVRIYHKMAKCLRAAGYCPVIINNSYEGVDSMGIRFVKITKSRNRAARMTQDVYRMYKKIVQIKPLVCHIHDPELLTIIRFIKKNGIKTVYDSHECLKQQIKSKNWVPKILRRGASMFFGGVEHALAGSCDAVIGATAEIAGQFKGAVVVKNLPTVEDYKAINSSLNFSLSKTKPSSSVCCIGAISESRGIFTVIDATAKAGVRLKLAGAFESDSLYRRVSAMEGWKNVDYLGVLNRTQVGELMAECGVGLLLLEATPAYQNSLPIKLFEYLSAGLRVVASDFSVWRGLNLGSLVSFVNPKNIDDVAAEIKKATQNPISPKQRQELALKEQAKHNFEQEGQKLLELYEKLLKEQR